MYSSTYNKAVFIDFGLSLIIAEDLGNLKLMHFRGTFMYACDEFKNICSEQGGYIDVYHNDRYGL
jgi:hypothetical protein